MFLLLKTCTYNYKPGQLYFPYSFYFIFYFFIIIINVSTKIIFLLCNTFITLRSQFHLHHRSQRALTEIVSKIAPNLGL